MALAIGEKALFISDIHSNLEALEAVLNRNEDLKVFCLGDIVGYGASPNQVIELLRKRGAVSVMGNHDNASVTGKVNDFNSRAAIAALWTGKSLTEENRQFLTDLPRERTIEVGGERVYMTHGSPDDNLWEYVHPTTHSELFDHYLSKFSVRAMGLGHTHLPFVWRSSKGVVFNPGSVGQPRDGDPNASYAILYLYGGRVEVEHGRVEYDVEKSAKKILDAGLPEALARRLLVGE